MKNVMEGITRNYIGAMCSNFRRYILHESQTTIAKDCNVSRELVSKFENGENANAIIFMWYIKRGLFDWVPPRHWNGW